MKKVRLFFLFLALLVVVCSTLGVNAAAKKVVIKWGTVFAPDMPMSQAVKRVGELLAEKSNGTIELQFFPSGQLGTNTEIMAQLVQGLTQMNFEGGGFLSQWSPKYLLAEAAYVFRDVDHMLKVMTGPTGQEMADELLRTRGVQVLDIWYYGTRHLTSNRPIYTRADMSGLKLRVPDGPLYVANGQALGANPTPVALSEVYLGLKTGVVDAQENPLPTIDSFKFYEVQKYLILTGHSICPQMIMVNEKFWQSLTADQRELIMEVIKEGGRYNLELTLKMEKDLIGTFKEYGMTIIEPDRESFMKGAGEVLEQRFGAQWGKGLYKQVQEMK